MNRKRRTWRSGITSVSKDKLITHGIDQVDIIRSFSYEELVFLLILGRKATELEAKMLRYVMLSHCSHGITGQSTLAVRMGADTEATFLSSAVGGFLTGSGPYHQGGLERAMIELKNAYTEVTPIFWTVA